MAHKAKPSDSPSYAAPRPTLAELQASGEKLNRTGTEFLKTDLKTLLTFTSSALQTDNPEKRTRQRRVARKGYDTVLRLLKKVTLTKDDAVFISKHLRRLKSELKTLGEVF